MDPSPYIEPPRGDWPIRQTKGTPSGWGTGGELELCSLSTSCCTAPPSGLEASPWASRAPAIPVENQRSRPFQIPFLRAFGCTPFHTVGLQAFLTSVGSTVATPAFTEKAQQQTAVHLMLPWSVWGNVARSTESWEWMMVLPSLGSGSWGLLSWTLCWTCLDSKVSRTGSSTW